MKQIFTAALLLLVSATTVSAQQNCQALDVVFVIDRTGSIRDTNEPSNCPADTECDNWLKMRNFVNDLIDRITPDEDTRFGAVVFGNNNDVDTTVVFEITDDRASAKTQVTNIPYRAHFTSTYRGLREARFNVFTQSGDRAGVPNVIVLITDGQPNLYDGGGSTVDETQALADAVAQVNGAINDGIIVLSVGVTNRVDRDTIIQLSSDGIGANAPVKTSLNFPYCTHPK